jgi:hypothetical protein
VTWIVLVDDHPVFDFTVLCWWWQALRFFVKKFIVQCKPFTAVLVHAVGGPSFDGPISTVVLHLLPD